MGVRHFTGLVAWRLADDVRKLLGDLTRHGPAAHDSEFGRQLRRSADSACDNIAEGFGRYRHRDFSRFLTIAKSSLDEAESQLLGGVGRGYVSQSRAAEVRVKLARTRTALLRLKRYLDSTDAPSPVDADR